MLTEHALTDDGRFVALEHQTSCTTAHTVTTEVVARCRAFSGEGVRWHRAQVEMDGTFCNAVRVWDAVAGHYTTCHSLSPAAKRRLVQMALAVAAHR